MKSLARGTSPSCAFGGNLVVSLPLVLLLVFGGLARRGRRRL